MHDNKTSNLNENAKESDSCKRKINKNADVEAINLRSAQ